jgi:capsule polysaccharide export protein KpsE/RkpR
MADTHDSTFLDYIVLMVKWKRPLLILAASLFVVSYIAIYLFIDPEYESTATIMPTEDKQMSGISSLMKNLGNLPIGLGPSTRSADLDLYTTIINSRPLLEKIIVKFDLLREYRLESMEKAVKQLRKKIKGRVNDENAYEIEVRAGSAQKSADIANYVLEELNRTVIDLNVTKSRNNRIFLELRYIEMTNNLRSAEDSLQYYQESTGMLEAKEQTKMIITTYSTLEAELISKQIELSILENTLSKDSPQLENLRVEVKEYAKKLDQMKKEGEDNGIILALNTLPVAAKHYIRHYRDVEIYSKILEFLIPMYEQARFDEQKDVPVLQIIEHPVPPEKKAYPPRAIFSLMITFGGLIIAFFYVLIIENDNWKQSERIIFIKENLLRWKGTR